MSFQHKITSTYGDDSGTVIAATSTYSGTADVGFDGTIGVTTDNVEVDIGWLHANVHSLLLYSSTALTVKTNSSSAPGQTLTLAAGQALVWGTDHAEANPVTGDVTKLFLSNDTANVATVKIRVLIA